MRAAAEICPCERREARGLASALMPVVVREGNEPDLPATPSNSLQKFAKSGAPPGEPHTAVRHAVAVRRLSCCTLTSRSDADEIVRGRPC